MPGERVLFGDHLRLKIRLAWFPVTCVAPLLCDLAQADRASLTMRLGCGQTHDH